MWLSVSFTSAICPAPTRVTAKTRPAPNPIKYSKGKRLSVLEEFSAKWPFSHLYNKISVRIASPTTMHWPLRCFHLYKSREWWQTTGWTIGHSVSEFAASGTPVSVTHLQVVFRLSRNYNSITPAHALTLSFSCTKESLRICWRWTQGKD